MVFLLDDDWDNDPRVSRAGTAAFGLYCRCGMWVARHLNDGLVPREIAANYGTPEWAAKLVDVGLWEMVEGGFRIVHYFERNPTREKELKRREQVRRRQERWRTRRGSNASRNASDNGAPSPPPKGGKGARGATPIRAVHEFDDDGQGACLRCGLPYRNAAHGVAS